MNAPDNKWKSNEALNSFGMSISELFDVLASSRRLSERIKDPNRPLSDKNRIILQRAMRVWPRAVHVLSDRSAAETWLTQSNCSLGGESPLELLDDEDGCTLVLDTLGRIEYGVVS